MFQLAAHHAPLSGLLCLGLLDLPAAPDCSMRDTVEPYRWVITEAAFRDQLDRLYLPGGGWQERFTLSAGVLSWVEVKDGVSHDYRLELAATREEQLPPPRRWRRVSELGKAPDNAPLTGLRIGLDPGHIGGAWAEMEERSFGLGGDAPFREGDGTLLVARLLQPLLEAGGAEVFLVRTNSEPLTTSRPEDFLEEARRQLLAAQPEMMADPVEEKTIRKQAERLFYRKAEITARAEAFCRWAPDVILSIHFNATDWPNPQKPSLVAENHLHALVNGSFSLAEIQAPENLREMFWRIFQQTSREEIPLAEGLCQRLAADLQLPPKGYAGPIAVAAGKNPYVWARNLLATRIYPAPTILLEPLVANSLEAYPRLQAGDYEGRREIAGRWQRSIYREYAEAVASGMAEYYRDQRNKTAP